MTTRPALYPLALVAVVAHVALLAACGSPAESADPRCAAVCRIEEPSISGAYDICSQDSANACIKECGVRIGGVSTVCASCLLERAGFGGGDSSPGQVTCSPDMCTASNGSKSCSYAPDDNAQKEACIRMLYPRREVACSVRWRPVNDCAAVCM